MILGRQVLRISPHSSTFCQIIILSHRKVSISLLHRKAAETTLDVAKEQQQQGPGFFLSILHVAMVPIIPPLFKWIYFFCFSVPLSGVVASMCRVSGGVLGIPCSSVIGLGWQPLAVDQGGTQCWESCCLEPSCSAVWSLGGYCVLLKCARPSGCEISALPLTHINSLGILQLLDKSKSKKARIPRQARVADVNGGPGHKRSNHVCVMYFCFIMYIVKVS